MSPMVTSSGIPTLPRAAGGASVRAPLPAQSGLLTLLLISP